MEKSQQGPYVSAADLRLPNGAKQRHEYTWIVEVSVEIRLDKFWRLDIEVDDKTTMATTNNDDDHGAYNDSQLGNRSGARSSKGTGTSKSSGKGRVYSSKHIRNHESRSPQLRTIAHCIDQSS